MESICLDLNNVFESFLPQLLSYPNSVYPLNGDAAALYLHKPEDYQTKIKGESLAFQAREESAEMFSERQILSFPCIYM